MNNHERSRLSSNHVSCSSQVPLGKMSLLWNAGCMPSLTSRHRHITATLQRRHRLVIASSSSETSRGSAKIPFSFSAGADPFSSARKTAAELAAATEPQQGGVFSPPGLPASTLSVTEADTLLARFERNQREVAAGGFGKTVSGAPSCTLPPLKVATLCLAAEASHIMMGICASNQAQGLQALKGWTRDLGLPKGKLHGMDQVGKPVNIPGAVFIKYNSTSGDAFISGYAGEYRGVLYTPQLVDGVFRQYGYLPLNLLEEK